MRYQRAIHLVVAVMLLALTARQPALAQVFEATASGAAAVPVTGQAAAASHFSVALRQVRLGSTTVGVALGYSSGARALAAGSGGAAGDTGAAQLDLTLSANETFGPIGNVIFELSGSLRTDALAQGALTVRGTVGPLAARLSLTAFGADQVVFSPTALASDDRPSLGSAGLGAALGVTARFGRSVIVDVEPDVHLTEAGLATRLEARLRRLRTFGDNELRLYLASAWAPAGWTPGVSLVPGQDSRWHAAVGAGVLWPRGRAPDIEVAALLGINASRVGPGLRVSLAESLPGGTRLGLEGSLEPYRVDVHPLRLAATASMSVAGDATLGFTAVAAALDATRPAAFSLQATYRVPVALR